ncbi:hypothetical protein [Phormidium sp. CCY1219]|uniref:hypothetical protein n=1 Tax=Phormidium sp. CCY1219 TaxID=2886104 RepID=UPI002D1F0031|nr:hypothetical protein [Phormidium sp. CCY1219]MEB3827569.1 hypothetical protein [Phormidium sp. CCY1219]
MSRKPAIATLEKLTIIVNKIGKNYVFLLINCMNTGAERLRIEKIGKNRQAGQWFNPVGAEPTPGKRPAFAPPVPLSFVQCASCSLGRHSRPQLAIGNSQFSIHRRSAWGGIGNQVDEFADMQLG